MLKWLRPILLASVAILAILIGPASSASAAPANDNFASRQALTGALPITTAANNIGATAEAGEPDIYTNDVQRSVWFSWTAPGALDLVIDQCGAGFTGEPNPFIGMAVRTGTSLGSLVLVKETAGRCLLRFHATAGVTYNFQIDYRSSEGNFNLKLRGLAPPLNDSFASATVLGPALPLTRSGTTVDSTWEAGEPPSLGGSSQSRSVWYSWTAPATERVRLSLCEKTYVDGPLNDMTVVYTGATLGTLVPISTLTSSDCNMDFPVTAGTTYRIAVSGYIIGDFDFVLGLKAAPPPANDNFADAQAVGPGLPAHATGNNDFATTEAGEPNHGGYSPTSRSVWFSWTAPITGRVRLKACGSNLQLFNSVYTGTALGALTDVGQRFYYARCSSFFDAVAGTTYRIAVAGGPFERTHGPFALEIHRVLVPTNDAFSSAIKLGPGLSVSRKGTTVDASTEEHEPDHTGSYGDYGGSVWYRWTAPSDSAAIISACSAGEPTLLAVYAKDPEAENPGIQALKQLDNDAEACRGGAKGGRLAIAPVKGVTYFVAVAAAQSDFESPFNLKIETYPASVKPAFNLKAAIAKCRKLKGKRKRVKCIKDARKKAALIKCGKLENPKAKAKCIRSAKRRYK